ncbi:MAG TPA: carboxypeptidase M32 [Caldimonas sp.]|nr:carboxypeptidase M32 [Caldimonas sp.]
MEDTRSRTPCYDALVESFGRRHRLDHLLQIALWDRAALMPRKGGDARAAAVAEMEALLHRLATDPQLRDWLERAQDEPLDDAARANLREMQRAWRRSNALPETLVEAVSLAASRCQQGWERQRPANDWAGFLESFREVVRLGREVARHLADDGGVEPYDALLDLYEPGMRTAELDRLFGDLQGWLPELVRKVRQRQERFPVEVPKGPFPKERQRALGLEVMALLGFDFEAGRLDESAHPFSGGVPEDTRLTTRYREDDVLQSLMATIHETGHARYEQNLPRDWLGQPIGAPRSMAVHESQSLSFEMQLARSPGFAALMAPRLSAAFGAQAAFEPDNLRRLLTRVAPGLIRVDADELTYPAHVVLRYGIERPLIEGTIEAEDIPALWDEGMSRLLGVDTRGNFRDGCLQDVHWSEGLFGYFPCYTLGAMYAAQWFATIRALHPQLDRDVAAGRPGVVFEWLHANVWSQASRLSTADLALRATGSVLDPTHFRRHLEARYLG